MTDQRERGAPRLDANEIAAIRKFLAGDGSVDWDIINRLLYQYGNVAHVLLAELDAVRADRDALAGQLARLEGRYLLVWGELKEWLGMLEAVAADNYRSQDQVRDSAPLTLYLHMSDLRRLRAALAPRAGEAGKKREMDKQMYYCSVCNGLGWLKLAEPDQDGRIWGKCPECLGWGRLNRSAVPGPPDVPMPYPGLGIR